MKDLRTQDEIIANWKGDIDKPVVSICCITYNHEPYIEDALKGFLIQETDFPFEILIHDDASTDRTADIIREYEAKYPRLIKPIYQTENQYSQNRMVSIFNTDRVKSDYIALCEGDDYWISTTHLVDGCIALKSNNNISIYGAACYIARNGSRSLYIPEKDLYNLDSYIFEAPFVTTCSLIVRTSIYKEIIAISVFGGRYFAGDTRLKLISLTKGNMYINRKVSVNYNKGTVGSWTNRIITEKVIIRELLDNLSITREIGCFNNYSNDKALFQRIEDEFIRKGAALSAMNGAFSWLLFVFLNLKSLSPRNIKSTISVLPIGKRIINIKHKLKFNK